VQVDDVDRVDRVGKGGVSWLVPQWYLIGTSLVPHCLLGIRGLPREHWGGFEEAKRRK